MNIAYITADFGIPIFGCKGASIHVGELVTSLSRKGHSVCVISPAMNAGNENGQKSNFGEDVNPNIDFATAFGAAFLESHEKELLKRLRFLSVLPPAHHLQVFTELKELDGFLGKKTTIRQELRSILYNLTLADQAAEFLRDRSIDVVYERYSAFSYAGINLARALGVPHILEVNAPLSYEHEKRRGMELKELVRDVERQIFRQADHVVVVSQHLKEFVSSCGVRESSISVLPNGVDPRRFMIVGNGKSVRELYGLNGKRVIGFVGTLKPWHGTETLLKAFQDVHAQDPHTHLLIVGDGPERKALEGFRNDAGLTGGITFTGNIPFNEIPNYIRAMDITVAPYIPNENFYYSPIKIFEYMAMGKPVVAARIGQLEEVVVEGETGVLFEPGNIAQLSQTLTELIHNKPLCQRIGEGGRVWVQRERTWERNAEKVIEIAQTLSAKIAAT